MSLSSKIFVQDIDIPALHRKRTIRILLPVAYYKYPTRKFPVVYMLDGQNLFDKSTAYHRPWNIQKTIDKLPLKDQVIIVGIDNGGLHRGSEYSPKSKWPLIPKSEANKFLQFIVDELKPKVDFHLRTLTDRQNTLIIGSSLGGLFAYYAMMVRSDIFGKAGILSPAFWIYPHIFSLKPDHFGRIYVLGSKSESKGMEKDLVSTYWALKKMGCPPLDFRVVIKDRGRHSEVLWGQQFGPMLRWLMHGV